MSFMSLREMLMWDIPCVEPQKRMHAGKFGWVVHRFPIKGGIPPRISVVPEWRQKLASNITSNNVLLKAIDRSCFGPQVT